jgi:hypothetical protein
MRQSELAADAKAGFAQVPAPQPHAIGLLWTKSLNRGGAAADFDDSGTSMGAEQISCHRRQLQLIA